MPIKATDLKRGNALIWEGQLHVVIGTEHTKPGKGPAYVQAKMKNVATGTINVEITEPTPQPKGATVTNQLKEAVVETGARVRVPSFIEQGTVVRINTETGEYLGKA